MTDNPSRLYAVSISGFFICFVMRVLFVKLYPDDFVIAGTEVSPVFFLAFISILGIACCFLMVTAYPKRGYTTATICFEASVVSMIYSVFIAQNINAIPGFFVDVAGIIFLFFHSRMLREMEQIEMEKEKSQRVDALSGIPNNKGITEKMQTYIDIKAPFTYGVMHIRHFKKVNETFGHENGDRLICILAREWTEMAPKGAVVARNGSDEFAFLLPGNSRAETQKFFDNIVRKMAHGYVLPDSAEVCFPSISAGVTFYPFDTENIENLSTYANAALSAARKEDASSMEYYDPSMIQNRELENQLETIVKNALTSEGFFIELQPQFTAKEHKLRGFETLIGLRDRDGRRINPGKFIPLAERSGLILEIDRWVVHNTIASFAEVIKREKKDVTISVNVSAKHILVPGFVDEIKKELETFDFPPHNLEIEVTEYCLVQSVDAAAEVLSQFREMGIHIALDDFGTGYTSLSYLSRLPFNLLKVDKVFVDDMDSETGRKFVKAVVGMGHLFGAKVIAEGVEQEYQLEALKEFGCEYIQGYIWGKRISLEDAIKMVEEA